MKVPTIKFFSLALLCQNFDTISALYRKVDLRGDVWPKPQSEKRDSQKLFKVDLPNLTFQFDDEGTPSSSCATILNDNFARYEKLIKNIEYIHWGGTVKPDQKLDDQNEVIDEDEVKNIIEVKISNKFSCDAYPQLNDDEKYEIEVSPSGDQKIFISAHTIWGSIRAIESVSQLIFHQNKNAYIHHNFIEDWPEYTHRGFFLDTSRHFQTLDVVKQMLDGMAYNKLNVFHWHMVNDQSFSYNAFSEKFSFLAENGAYPPYENHSFNRKEIEEIIEYGRMRGIRIYPEFDTPGHVRSWCDGFDKNGYEQFCMRCPGNDWDFMQTDRFYGWGPVNPSKDTNYVVLDEMWGEIRDVFKDDFIHIGGDEVPDNCYLNNNDTYVDPDEFKNWADKNNLKTKSNIMRYHLDKMYDISEKYNFSYIVWNEAEGFDDEPEFNDLDMRTKKEQKPVVHNWMPWGPSDEVARFWRPVAENATAEGYQLIQSAGWYLDLIKYPEDGYSDDWRFFYENDPRDFDGTNEQKELVLGGEGAWWTEYIDSTGVVTRTFPRVSAMAERLWSDPKMTSDFEDAFPRLDQFRCWMLNRGIPAEPIGVPSSCNKEWDIKYVPVWEKEEENSSSTLSVVVGTFLVVFLQLFT